jgi:hypothetical protein
LIVKIVLPPSKYSYKYTCPSCTSSFLVRLPVLPVHTCSQEGFFTIPPEFLGRTDLTPLSLLNIASLHQKHPLASVAISVLLRLLFSLLFFIYYFRQLFVFGIKRIELAQCLVSLSVNPSPTNSCPKCPPQLAHCISILIPSGSSHAGGRLYRIVNMDSAADYTMLRLHNGIGLSLLRKKKRSTKVILHRSGDGQVVLYVYHCLILSIIFYYLTNC